MDEKKEEKIVIESQKEEIKTDTEKTERSRNRITKIKQIKVKKGISNIYSNVNTRQKSTYI